MAVLSAYFYEIVYLTVGLLCGAIITVLAYIVPSYRKLNNAQNDNAQLRESCLVYQKQLSVFQTKNKELEKQLRNTKVPSSADPILDKNTDQSTIDNSYWPIERQLLQQEYAQLKDELSHLQQEKNSLENGLQQANERWKLEREKLQQTNKELTQQLHSHSTEPAQSDVTNNVVGYSLTNLNKADEWRSKLEQHQAAWQRDRKLLQAQLVRVKADKKALETELVSQTGQAEREKQALEQEIELLTARMLRFQNELERRQLPQYPEAEFDAILTSPLIEETIENTGEDIGEETNQEMITDTNSEPTLAMPPVVDDIQPAPTNSHGESESKNNGNGASDINLAETDPAENGRPSQHHIANENQSELPAENPQQAANDSLNS